MPSYTGQTVNMTHGTSSIDIVLSATDGDAGDTLTYSHAQPATGTGTVTQGVDDHHLTYHAPAGGLQSPTSFTYAVTDGYSTPASQTITINPPPNNVPSYTDHTVNMTHGTTSVQITLTATDTDNDSLTFTHTQPATGTGTITGTGANLTYTAPTGGMQSPASFTYTVTDGYSTPASQTITINPPPNNVPSYTDQTVNMTHRMTSVQITLTATDGDAGDTLTYTHTQPANGTGTVTQGVDDHHLIYHAPAGGMQSAASFTYAVTDGYSTPASQTITINPPPNAAPVLDSGSQSINVTVPVFATQNITVSATDARQRHADI